MAPEAEKDFAGHKAPSVRGKRTIGAVSRKAQRATGAAEEREGALTARDWRRTRVQRKWPVPVTQEPESSRVSNKTRRDRAEEERRERPLVGAGLPAEVKAFSHPPRTGEECGSREFHPHPEKRPNAQKVTEFSAPARKSGVQGRLHPQTWSDKPRVTAETFPRAEVAVATAGRGGTRLGTLTRSWVHHPEPHRVLTLGCKDQLWGEEEKWPRPAPGAPSPTKPSGAGTSQKSLEVPRCRQLDDQTLEGPPQGRTRPGVPWPVPVNTVLEM